MAGLGSVFWLRHSLSPIAADPEAAKAISFEVAPGDSLTGIAQDLERRGLVRNARVTSWFARSRDLASRLKVGEYELSPDQSTPEILDVLARGEVLTHSIALPEGLRATEIADRLAAAGLAERDAFLAIALDPNAAGARGLEGTTLEGYRFPDTYRFARGLPAERVVDAMVEEFRSVYRELEPAARARGLSMLEVVTLASIVEKETGAPQERPLIAAVFLNRLERGMRLETDPTVIYGIPDFDGNLRRIHLEDRSNPYNTYRIKALPPGPIASPGEAALRAILSPADSSFLYFVSRNDGTHVFSRTYAEHKKAVDHYQRRRRR